MDSELDNLNTPVASGDSRSVLSSGYTSEYSSFSGSDPTWTSSGSTIPGIGSLTGKAIKALGSIVLRGLDRFIIYAHIRAILSKFPHSDTQAATIEGIQEIYDIILELSRPKIYSESLRRTALMLLLPQINNGHTRELEQALDRWNSVELEIFFHGLVLQSAVLNPNFSIQDNSTPSPVLLDLKRIIVLMGRIAQKSKQGCQAVLNVGFFRLFVSIEEAQLSRLELAEIYRTVLCVSKRSESQFRTSREEAICLLVNSISLLRPSFVKALALWDAEDLKALVDMVLEHLAPPRHLPSRDLEDIIISTLPSRMRESIILSTLSLLHRVGRASELAHQNTFRAGYLDILLRIDTLQYPVQQFEDDFEAILHLFRHHLPLYTKEERNKAMDVLLFQIVDDCQYVFDLLQSWDPTEIEDLLRALVEKLRAILYSGHGKDNDDMMSRLVTFIAKNALSDYQICEVIVSAGFFNILYSYKEENEEVKILIVDILEQKKHTSLVKQSAAQFISYQIASGRGDSWPHLSEENSPSESINEETSRK